MLHVVRRELDPQLFSVTQHGHPSLLTHSCDLAAQGLARGFWDWEDAMQALESRMQEMQHFWGCGLTLGAL